MGMKHSPNSSRKVSTMTEEDRISSIKFICKLIETISCISADDQWFCREHVTGLANDQILEYLKDEGIEGEVIMYSPRSHGHVIRIGDVEYGRDGKFTMLTENGRANILGGILEIPYIDALMRIVGFSRLPESSDGSLNERES